MAGVNRGNTFIESYGTTSPASGEAPTDINDGQPMDGLATVQCVVSAPYGETLSSAGGLLAYVCDAVPLSGNGDAVAASPAVVRLAYEGLTGGFVVGDTVTGDTSGATGVVFDDVPDSTNGTLYLSGAVGTFESGEGISGAQSGSAFVSGPTTLAVLIGTAAQPFETGQRLTGRTSRATARVVDVTDGELEIDFLDGDFAEGEVLTGLAQPRWTRCPSLDIPIPPGQSPMRDISLPPVSLAAPRKGRVKWVPVDVTFSGGETGVTVHQFGQTYLGLYDAGK